MIADQSGISLTIGVVTWEHERYVARCLQSIVDSTLEGYSAEVVIIDNHSTDETAVLIDEFISKKNLSWSFSKSPLNRGSKWALNEILDEARGEYFVWLSGDDFVHPDRFQAQLEAFSRGSSDVVMVSGTTIEVDEVDQIRKGRPPIRLSNKEIDFSLRNVVFAGEPGPHVVCQMLRTSALRSVGGWNYDDVAFNDTPIDFLLGMLPDSRVRIAPSATTFYRVHPHMSSVRLNSRHFVSLYEFFLKNDQLTEAERLTVREWLRRSKAHSMYEVCLVDFGECRSRSRLALFRATFLRDLRLRSRLNCLALSVIPFGTRKRCKSRYAM